MIGGGLCVAAALLAFAAGLVQTGPLLTAEPLKPDVSRLSPVEGLRRLPSRRTFVRGVLGACKLVVATLIVWGAVSAALGSLVAAPARSSEAIAAWGGALVVKIALAVAGGLLVLAAIDLLYQRWQHRQDLKMTRREYLDDLRKMEGDPTIRRRRRKEMRARRIAAADRGSGKE